MVFSVFLCCALALLLWVRERERPELVALKQAVFNQHLGQSGGLSCQKSF